MFQRKRKTTVWVLCHLVILHSNLWHSTLLYCCHYLFMDFVKDHDDYDDFWWWCQESNIKIPTSQVLPDNLVWDVPGLRCYRSSECYIASSSSSASFFFFINIFLLIFCIIITVIINFFIIITNLTAWGRERVWECRRFGDEGWDWGESVSLFSPAFSQVDFYQSICSHIHVIIMVIIMIITVIMIIILIIKGVNTWTVCTAWWQWGRERRRGDEQLWMIYLHIWYII